MDKNKNVVEAFERVLDNFEDVYLIGKKKDGTWSIYLSVDSDQTVADQLIETLNNG